MSVVRDPPDLGADFPDAFRSLRPDHPFSRTAPGFLSWGCPKIRPSIVRSRRIRFPEGALRLRRARASRRRVAGSSFVMGMPVPIRVPPSWFLTTSTDSSSPTLRPFSGRCRSWGSLRFLLSRNRISRGAPAALRSFPSADSDGGRRTNPVHRGARVTAATVSGRRVHREPCPLALSSRVSAGSGLEALLHRRVRCAAGRFRSSVPGAPLGLSGSARLRGKPARDEHAGFTSKTTPKNGSSV